MEVINMADELKNYIGAISKIMDGPVQVSVVYDPKAEGQKVFIVAAEKLQQLPK